MNDLVYGPTNNRRVLGTAVDFAKVLPHYLARGDSLVQAARVFAGTPCGPLYKSQVFPHDAVTALFGAGWRDVRYSSAHNDQ